MLVKQNTTVAQLDSIKVGDNIEDENGNVGVVFKIDISKYRKVERYIFRIKNDGTIEVTK
ncbi:hypothetical protein ACFOG5_23630 [Pedobacter fastidiosus]|uniref:Uncharacterized protein n=1 Tax=Pedobacter fastidiosus TaxID=2765361 RepID=A0ABR7KXD9_9SPHI|nr:hypothetical protein [Pedobacter fastidiosus]MBC6112785.1 hypothetical protein [Pedobacter fastidiosus]